MRKSEPIKYDLFDSLSEEQTNKVFENLAEGLSRILSNKFDCYVKVSFIRKKELGNENSDCEQQTEAP